MKVSDVVIGAARLVLNGTTVDKIIAGSQLTSEETNALNQLVRAYNTVLKEVAIEYSYLVSDETVSGGKVYYSALSHSPLKIIGATVDGEKAEYKVFPTYVLLPEKQTILSYAYIPADKVLNDAFDYEGKPVGERAFIYGVAAEYCLASGRYNEAADWDSKYRKAAVPRYSGGAKRIKGRIWGL